MNYNLIPCQCGCRLEAHYPFDGTYLDRLEQWCGMECYKCTYGYTPDNLRYLELLNNVK